MAGTRSSPCGCRRCLPGRLTFFGCGPGSRFASCTGAVRGGGGLVTAGFAAGGLLAPGPPPAEPGPLLAAERQFHDVLLLNLGLNVAYSAVGATMLGASHYGVDNVGRWRGFGTSLILQGAGLLVLDGIAFWASRGRLASLLDAGVQLSMRPAPTGLALTLQF